jgi:hypothetical protein
MIMSTQLPLPTPLPADGVTAGGGVRPSGSDNVAPIGVDASPEVYCRIRAADHARSGLAPCTDLGCRGCARRE